MFSFLRRPAEPGRLSPDEFRARLAEPVPARAGNAVVLDVRTPAEYAHGHLRGARLVDALSPDFAREVEKLDRDRPYFLYCRSGNRSGRAARVMRDLGFQEVYNVGGFDDLARAGFDIAR